MKMSNLIFICLVSIFFISCGTEYKSDSSSSTPDNRINVTLAGIVVDGYISGATVCIDNNLNGECGIDEPITTTNSTGAFSFGENNINNGAVVSYVASGGIDIATGNNFNGKLRQISEVYTSNYVYLTPLTDLVAKAFFASPIKDLDSLHTAKNTISRAYSIHSDFVDQNPSTYAGVFARTQEIQQMIGLIGVSFIEAKGIVFTSAQKIELQENIKSSIIEDIDISVEPNVLNIISILEEDENLTIQENVKTFINEQFAYIKVDIENFVLNQNLSLDNLNEYQNALEDKADEAYARIDGSSGEALESFELNIDIFYVEDNVTVGDDNVTIINDINASFNGVVTAYGYLGDAVGCLDIDYNGVCTADESSFRTSVHGEFSFSEIILPEDTLFPIISNGGIDDYSSKIYDGELKNILLSDDLVFSEIVISTLTDLMSLDFLNNSTRDKSTLLASQILFSTKMGITVQQLLGDVTQDKKLFMRTVYLEHIKRFIGLVVSDIDEKEIIKQAILRQILNDGYDGLLVSRTLDYVEVNLGIAIANEDKIFVESILGDIKIILDEFEASSDIQTYTLPIFQRMLEDKLEESYRTKSYTPITMSIEEVIVSEYAQDGAIYDVQSCILDITYNNELVDTNATQGRESDFVQGLTIESNIEQVSLFYETFDLNESPTNILVYDLEDRFSFSFNEGWIQENKKIYIQTSKNEDELFSCYRVSLNSNQEANINLQKVFRYSN